MKSCFLAFMLLLASAGIASACSCLPSVRVDEEFARSKIVGVFKLAAVEKDEADPEKPFSGAARLKFTTEKVFKGDIKAGDILPVAQAVLGDCGKYFDEREIGREYLFYASYFKGGMWSISGCDRSAELRMAAADLLYLENMARVRGKTRISGTVTQVFGIAAEGDEERTEFLANSPVVLRGNGKVIRLRTDKNGVYEVYGLAPGKYTITPVKMRGYDFSHTPVRPVTEITLEAKGFEEWNFTYRIDNAIRGRLLDSKGKVHEDVCLELQPARGRQPLEFFEEACTDEKGLFEFESIPAGSYLIVVNRTGKVTADVPFGKFYYPSTFSRKEASPIAIGPGDVIKNLAITAPATAETVTISGVLRYKDGMPAPDIWVKFQMDKEEKEAANEVDNEEEDDDEENDHRVRLDRSEEPEARTDAEGRFSIQVLKGQKGVIVGVTFEIPGQLGQCPEMQKLARERAVEKKPDYPGDDLVIVELKSNEIAIEASGNQGGIEISFPFTFCKKKPK